MSSDASQKWKALWDLDQLRVARRAAYEGAMERVRHRSLAGDIGKERPDDEIVAADLSEAEAIFLREAIGQIWGGPAKMTEKVASLLDYEDANFFYEDQDRLVECARGVLPATRKDWRRILLAAELAFASYEHGGAWDWDIVTGIGDEASILVLRAVQSKLFLV